jgi:hypothetical protein
MKSIAALREERPSLRRPVSMERRLDRSKELRNRRHRWIRRLALSFAFAAIAAPTAQARIAEDSGVGQGNQVTSVRPDDRAVRGVPQSTDVNAVGWPDGRATRDVPQSTDVTVVVRPDDRAARFSPNVGSENLNLWRDPAAVTGNELVLRRDPGAAVESPVVAVPATDGQAFDWGDAGIGAAIMLGFLLLATGVAAAGRQSRKSLAGA